MKLEEEGRNNVPMHARRPSLSEGKDAGGRRHSGGNCSGGGHAAAEHGNRIGAAGVGSPGWRELRRGLRHGGADRGTHGRGVLVLGGVVGDGAVGALEGAYWGVRDGRHDARLVARLRGGGQGRLDGRRDHDDEEQDGTGQCHG